MTGAHLDNGDRFVLRAPRLAIADLTADGTAAVRLLAGYLRSWQIPVNVYSDRPAPTPAGPDPMAPEAYGELADLAGRTWQTVPASSIATGGDITVLFGAADGPLPGLAADTGTPLVALVPPGPAAGTRATIDRLHARSPLAGVLVCDAGDNDEDDGALGAWLAGRGLLWAGRLPTTAIPHENAVTDVAAWDDSGRRIDSGSLVLLANTAPPLADASAARRPAPAAGRSPQPPTPLRPSARRSARPARVLMVAGTHSSAGKSFLVAALARHFADRGLRVAPFKGQNMSNNARIVDGGEIGVAQYMQALAARVRPDVRMNPVLLKPQRQGSTTILAGRPAPDLTALPWRLRKPLLWPTVREALADLRADHDLVIVEGAGSPSDTYLYHNDIVNMRVARETAAPTLLVTDAGRGGSVAHCYGSWLLLPQTERALVRGWIFNLFYRTGNVALLQPGIDQLVRLTGVPSLGTLPELDHRLPDEDLHSGAAVDRGTGRTVAVIRYPQISNFDEFTALEGVAGVRLRWARDAATVHNADVVILPGSRHVAADLAWIRQRGIDTALYAVAASGRPVLGICGGLQMLGEELVDPDGVEEAATGLGLLPLRTTMHPAKIQTRTTTTFAASLPGVWAPLARLQVTGYEIRHGQTARTGSVQEILPDGRGFATGNVLAAYLHGLLESPDVVGALFGIAVDYWAELERSFDAVAAAAREHLDIAALETLVS